VNEGAERGIKLAYDFLDVARKNSNFQDILQIIENDRHLLSNQKGKPKINSQTWFIKLKIYRSLSIKP